MRMLVTFLISLFLLQVGCVYADGLQSDNDDLTGQELNKKADFYHGDVKCGVLATETNKLFAKAMEKNS